MAHTLSGILSRARKQFLDPMRDNPYNMKDRGHGRFFTMHTKSYTTEYPIMIISLRSKLYFTGRRRFERSYAEYCTVSFKPPITLSRNIDISTCCFTHANLIIRYGDRFFYYQNCIQYRYVLHRKMIKP